MPGHRETQATRREQILEAAYEVALRRGIDGLTVRAVAARARLSHSLVLFHFKRKDQLGLALLDRVLAGTLSLGLPDEIRTIRTARERLQALVRQEVQRLSVEPRRLRLLLEFWTRGGHNAVIRQKIGAGLDGYRTAFQDLVSDTSDGKASSRGSSAGLAAVAVSLIIGYPVQAMIDPERVPAGEYLAAVQGALQHLGLAACAVPHGLDDRYPMVPVRETAAGQIRWACTNPWHPHDPGPCPSCGHSGRPSSIGSGPAAEARCRKCRQPWLPAQRSDRTSPAASPTNSTDSAPPS
jgi:TetR/AcrR family transcriptional repressor of bet genes